MTSIPFPPSACLLLVALGCLGATCVEEDRAALARECVPERGCRNAAFVAAVEARCGAGPECTLSIRDAFPSVEAVWIVERGAARLDACKAIPVAPSIRRTYYPLCQYVLLQEGGQVRTFLRGHCDDVRVTGADLEVDPDHLANVTTIDPRAPLRVSTGEGDTRARRSLYVAPAKRELRPYPGDSCVGTGR